MMDMDAAVEHCTSGIGIWDWASNDNQRPDVAWLAPATFPRWIWPRWIERQHFPTSRFASSMWLT
jgi:xylulose-5-phosphate/fructose-6-phosphate phosphoketolase